MLRLKSYNSTTTRLRIENWWTYENNENNENVWTFEKLSKTDKILQANKEEQAQAKFLQKLSGINLFVILTCELIVGELIYLTQGNSKKQRKHYK